MDYLMGYLTTKHQHDAILLVVDIFSKMAILIPCKKTMTAQHNSQLFFEHVWKHYGLLTTIISDRVARFFSIFWKTLWQQLDMRVSSSTSFHPQTNGQTKVVNRLVVQLLCMYNHKHHRTWDESIPYIQHSYNRAQHSSMGNITLDICFQIHPKKS